MGVKPNTWKKSEELESSGTPECSEFNSKGQNTSHWGVLSVIGKVLKRRYRKCPRILNLDICNPIYGQKKGRESNWQFDSQPLKVGNRPAPDVRFGSAIRRWKISTRATTSVQTSLRSEVRARSYGLSKSRESRTGTLGWISRLHFGSPGNLCHWGVAPTGRRRVYYMGDGGGIPWVRAVVSLVVWSARGLSQHQRVSRKCELTTLWFVLVQIQAWSINTSS